MDLLLPVPLYNQAWTRKPALLWFSVFHQRTETWELNQSKNYFVNYFNFHFTDFD